MQHIFDFILKFFDKIQFIELIGNAKFAISLYLIFLIALLNYLLSKQKIYSCDYGTGHETVKVTSSIDIYIKQINHIFIWNLKNHT